MENSMENSELLVDNFNQLKNDSDEMESNAEAVADAACKMGCLLPVAHPVHPI